MIRRFRELIPSSAVCSWSPQATLWRSSLVAERLHRIEGGGPAGGQVAVGGGLQGRDVVHRQEGVVILAEADSGFGQFAFDERVAVEPVRGGEGEEGSHAYN